MANHNDLGKLGEDLAKNYLKKHGYKIIETNWAFQKAEIDIIAQKEKKLIAIEVKTRSTLYFGNPQDFVKAKKIKLLIKAIDEYVNQKNLDMEIRFDIIAIYKQDKKYNIEHLENAFYWF